MEISDDDLIRFEAEGAAALPAANAEGYVTHDGAHIWYASMGTGAPVILLHGGMGHGGNWGYQVPALVSSGYRAVVVDSRGHGRSTRDERPYTYELMAADVVAVMDELYIDRATFIGWSDGACIAMVLGAQSPERVAGVFFFACNMDPSGTKEIEQSATLSRCFGRHVKDYARLSATPDQFQAFAEAIGQMQRTEPNYSAADLAAINVPVAIVQSERDEFIKPEHAQYLARTIPGAELVMLDGVTHFAPLQRPGYFNEAMLRFVARVQREERSPPT